MDTVVTKMDDINEDYDSEEVEHGSDGHWAALIEETCKKMDLQNEISEGTEVLAEPLLTEFLEELRENLEKRINFAEYMKDEDRTYQEVQSTADQYRSLDDDEAFEKAWNERKYLLKRLIREYIEVIENQIENDDDQEAEETEENKDESETVTYY